MGNHEAEFLAPGGNHQRTQEFESEAAQVICTWPSLASDMIRAQMSIWKPYKVGEREHHTRPIRPRPGRHLTRSPTRAYYSLKLLKATVVSGFSRHRAEGGVAGEPCMPHSVADPSLFGDSAQHLDSTTARAFVECRAVLQQQLTGSLSMLFARLTGLTLHVVWHQSFPTEPRNVPEVICPAVRTCLLAGRKLPTSCRVCLARFHRSQAQAAREQHRFTGACGCTILWVTLPLAGAPFLTLMVQARLTDDVAKPRVRAASQDLPKRPGLVRAQLSGALGRSFIPEATLDQAEALLLLIVQDLDATVRAKLNQPQLDVASGRLQEGKSTEGSQGPASTDQLARSSSVGQVPGNHARHTVQAMLAYIHQHYRHPMALRELADSLDLNANYLSGLFHKTLGVTYHQYLGEMRLANAEELLRDTHACVGDISCAVGYASPNHFRHVFKLRHGLSPRAWRDVVASSGLS